MPEFKNLKSEYGTLWDTMTIHPEKLEAVTRIAKKLIGHKSKYLAVEAQTGVPWFVIAALHNRESDADFTTYLGNGQPLNRVTTIVPKGRGPWNSWIDGAIDALKVDGLDKVTDWGPERACFEIEKFNGFGYFNKGVSSPYLWSFSNHYMRGKYVADNQYSATTVDQQCGAIPILKRIMELDTSAKFKSGTATTIGVGVGGGAGATGFLAYLGIEPWIAVLVGVLVAAGIMWLLSKRK